MQEPLEERTCGIMSTTPPGLIEPRSGGLVVTAARAAEFFLTPARLRLWGMKSTLSLLDQAVTAGAGFGVNLILARWMVPEVYGAFAVAFAGFLLVSGFHSVLLLEPMSVIGPARYAGKLVVYFRSQIKVHALLVGSLSGVLLLGGLILWRAVPQNPLIGSVVGSGLALPFLLLTWLARRMCYVMQRPGLALQGSAIYLGLIAAGLLLLTHFAWLGSFTVFVLMGFGSSVSASLLLWRLGLLSRVTNAQRDISWNVVLREDWTYGRWLAGSAVLYAISNQTQTFIVAASLGLGSAGVLRAMQLPMLAMVQVITATALVVLPSLSYDFADGRIARLQRKTKIISIGLAGLALAFAVLLALVSGRVEHIFFNGKYAQYAWLMPTLALVPVCMAFSTGYLMALRALLKPHFDLVVNAIAAPVGIVSAFFFIRWWGLAGAAASMVLSFATYSLAALYLYEIGSAELGRTIDAPEIAT